MTSRHVYTLVLFVPPNRQNGDDYRSTSYDYHEEYCEDQILHEKHFGLCTRHRKASQSIRIMLASHQEPLRKTGQAPLLSASFYQERR